MDLLDVREIETLNLAVFLLRPEPTVISMTIDHGRRVAHATGEYERRVVSAGSPVFYDWFANAKGRVVALELHLSQADCPPLLWSALSGLPYVEFSPYPIIWFGSDDEVQPLGLERFGDLDFYVSPTGNWCILVGGVGGTSSLDRA
jgi:hypothetical protein